MTKKSKVRFICQSCGHINPQWVGRCPGCGEWNSVVEEIISIKTTESRNHSAGKSIRAISLSQVGLGDITRMSIGIGELDRVLGGGLVSGSVVLVGGDPGVGKTTLLMQALSNLSKKGISVLYVTGEESCAQLKIRGERLGLETERLFTLFATDISDVVATIESSEPSHPKVVVIDSIQTTSTDEIESPPGSISQLRAVSQQLTQLAKKRDISIFLVGHITKEGSIAGPKVLEHLVDTVLYFESGGGYSYRILKAHKNRFGPTHEVGVFEMGERGLVEVKNPSEFFLSERMEAEPGSAVTAALEGTRTILVEVQCLTVSSPLAVPRRTSMGIDYNRVNIIAAVLERKGGINLSNYDIYVNVVGGIRILETAADLALAASMAGSFLDVPIKAGVVVFGEIGLAGEVRGVSQGAQRIAEAKKLGFKKAVVPQKNAEEPGLPKGIEVKGVRTVRDLIETLFEKR